MKKILISLLLLVMMNVVRAENNTNCSDLAAWFKPVCISQRLKQIWTEGNNELYFTGYAWHNRYTYPPARIRTYNELAWGGGLGKGLYDENGDWHGLYTFAFLDSHKNVQPVAGYAFLKVAHLSDNMRVGAGFAALVTVRPDINHGIPFPGALPWLSFNYRKVTLSAIYIPGLSKQNGNVLFLLGKWTFDLM